ncbi:MAG: phospholipase [Acidobacteriota bacterium]
MATTSAKIAEADTQDAGAADDLAPSAPERFTVPALFHGACLLDEGPAGAPLLFACHGYGEDGQAMMDALRKLPSADRLTLAAVEAPHPFYTKSGRVVRSWMTRIDRELAIEDNIRYITSVVAEVRRRVDTGPLVFVGFSQGVAMAWRAAVRSGFPCAGLIALAGDVPPDVAALAPPHVPPVLLGRGTRDEWYNEKKMRADLEVLDRLGADVETCVFEGGHEWTGDFFGAMESFLEVHAPSDRRR